MSDVAIKVFNLKGAQLRNFKQWIKDEKPEISESILLELEGLIKDNPEQVDYVAVLGDVIFSKIYSDYTKKAWTNDLLIPDLMKLKPLTTAELKPYADVLADIILNHPTQNPKETDYVFTLQEYEDDSFYDYPSFVTKIFAIDIEPLEVEFSEWWSAFSQEFKAVLSYFKERHSRKNLINDILFKKVYFQNHSIIAYTLTVSGTRDEKFFWNIYMKDLVMSHPCEIVFDQPIYFSLDEILDKIREKGIESLTLEEKEFLEKQ